MPAVANDASPGMRHDAKGSLFAMNLGGQTIDQLADLVNWSNAADYKGKTINPWVSIESGTASASAAPASAPVTVSAEPLKQAVFESSDEMVEEIAAETMMAKDALPVEDLVTNEVAQAVDVIQVVELIEVAEPAAAIASPDASESAEAITDDEGIQAADEAVPAVIETPVQKLPKQTIAPVPLPSVAQISAPAVQTRPTQETKSNTAAEPARGSKAIQPRTIPAMNTPTKIIRQDAGSDNQYLHRLESLVLELNLQLARVNNTNIESNADYTHWLSQRVIDLSLENMALQEELAKHKSH
jgi:hypothetical protein